MLSGQVLFCYSNTSVNTTEVSVVKYKSQWRTIKQRPYLKYLLMTCNETKQAVTGLHFHLEHSERRCSSAGVQDWNVTEHLWVVNILPLLDVQSNSFQIMYLSHSLHKQNTKSGTDFPRCWMLTHSHQENTQVHLAVIGNFVFLYTHIQKNNSKKNSLITVKPIVPQCFSPP